MERAIALLKSVDRRLKRAERQFARANALKLHAVLNESKSVLTRMRTLRDALLTEKRRVFEGLIETLQQICQTLSTTIDIEVGGHPYQVTQYGLRVFRTSTTSEPVALNAVFLQLYNKPVFWELLDRCIERLEAHLSSPPELAASVKDLKPLTVVAERIARLSAPLEEAPAPD